MLGFGGWAFFKFGRDFYGFVPLSGFAISPAVGRESVGGRASVLGLVGGWVAFEFGRDFYGFVPLSGFAISLKSIGNAWGQPGGYFIPPRVGGVDYFVGGWFLPE